ncbi:MAG: hydroxymethylbilane synthase [Planctomycetota bacterium]
MKLDLATRGSQLARWQARTTQALLRDTDPGLEVELEVIESSGDLDQASALARFGRIGIFTVEVDRALLDGRAQIGVHSCKDMTTSLMDGICLAGVLPRGPVEDVLVSPAGHTLDELPEGARVASGSLRRKAQLLAQRPDLQVIDIRGNVDTRLRKLRDGEAEALLLARAGLERLGLGEHITEVLDTERFLPAVSQGIVGLTCRSDDEATQALLKSIRDEASWDQALAERSLLRNLNGGCNAPIAGHALIQGDQLTLRGRVLSLDGERELESELKGPRTQAEALGVSLAESLREMGADELVEQARVAAEKQD